MATGVTFRDLHLRPTFYRLGKKATQTDGFHGVWALDLFAI